jgi:hypothetical protein
VKISLLAGEMGNCLMPSFINTGMEFVIFPFTTVRHV